MGRKDGSICVSSEEWTVGEEERLQDRDRGVHKGIVRCASRQG